MACKNSGGPSRTIQAFWNLYGSTMPPEPRPEQRRAVTSEGLTPRAIGACWCVALALMTAGTVATFVAGTGAAPATMILFGSLFLLLALMKRVPLNLEVGSAKLNASYEVEEAFEAGRDAGREQAVRAAIADVEDAEEHGQPPHEVLESRLEALTAPRPRRSVIVHPDEASNGYTMPVVCSAAAITYRQADFWARTGLVEPSKTIGDGTPLYSTWDIVLLRVVKRLLDAGLSLRVIRGATDEIRAAGPSATDKTLISDGVRTVLVDSLDDFGWSNLSAGIWTISLKAVRREVEQALAQLPGPGA